MNENFNENCIDAETSSAVGSVGSLGSVGPRFALKITALRAKIGSVVPTALMFIFALRAKMSLCMESVCLEVGWALRLKFIENLIENCIDAGFQTVWKLKTPRLRGFATPIGATLRENVESVESVCLEAGGALRLKFIENFNENCIDAETSSVVGSVGLVGSVGSLGSVGSVGPRFALKITALRAKMGSFGGIVLPLLVVPYGQKSIKSKTNQTY